MDHTLNLNDFKWLDDHRELAISLNTYVWGWDKMPGQEKADYAVARTCADGLEVLIKK
jgi:hypothetical protein